MPEYRIERRGGQCRLRTVTEANNQQRTFYKEFPKDMTPEIAHLVEDRYGSISKLPGLKELPQDLREQVTKAMQKLAKQESQVQNKNDEVDDDDDDDDDNEEEEQSEEEGEEDEKKHAEEVRLKQSMGGKKGQAIKKAKAEGREYREGEEFELYGPPKQLKDTARKHSALDSYRRVKEGGRKGGRSGGTGNASGIEEDGDEEGSEEEASEDEKSRAEEARLKQSMGGKKGQAKQRAKAEGREYREGEEFELFGPPEQLKGQAAKHSALDSYRRTKEGGRRGGHSTGGRQESEGGDARQKEVKGGQKGKGQKRSASEADDDDYEEGDESVESEDVEEELDLKQQDARRKQSEGGKKGAAIKKQKSNR